MISISDEITTLLQALFYSGDVSAYIYSKLPKGSLKTGWIEQGLLSKGMKGQLRDKHNQESLVIPADRFTRLTRDMNGLGNASIAIIGPKGLIERKFVAMVYGNKEQSLVAFNIQNQSPLDIVRSLLQHGLGEKVSREFQEPNLDYIEQLKLDANEQYVEDMIVLSLPKGIVKLSEWIKSVMKEGSSDDIMIRHGTSKELPVFTALLTRWVNSLELFRSTRNSIAACLFMRNNKVDVCLWDSPQRIAAFAAITGIGFDEISRKYLVPMWNVPGESIQPIRQKKQVVLESKMSMSQRKPIADRQASISDDVKMNLESIASRMEKLSISELKSRLDNLESQVQIETVSSTTEKGSLDALQSRLADNIDRIETLSKRLVELEKRIKKIGNSR